MTFHPEDPVLSAIKEVSVKLLPFFILCGVVVVLGHALAARSTDAPPHAHLGSAVSMTLYQGKPIQWWAHRTVANRREANALRARLRLRLLPVENEYEHAARLFAIAYGVDAATLIRKGRCESSNWTRFHNASGASGPWQFLPSTWRSTPFHSFSMFEPYAAAGAAAWMHAHHRGSEWVCQ